MRLDAPISEITARQAHFGRLKPSSMSISALSQQLREAAESLSGVSDTARLDAELLMAHALKLSRSEMLMRQHDLAVPRDFAAMVTRRMAHEPVAYITGVQHFWDLELSVAPGVLIPRADSETLIETAAEYFAGRVGPKTIIDLGTGSGALIMAALSLFPQARGLAIDASAAALEIAERNRQNLGLTERLELRQLSWRDPDWISAVGEPFDLLLCNPPYVESDAELSPMVRDFEPGSALFAGADGMDDYRILIPAIAAIMAEGGAAIFEIGATQGEAVGALAREVGFTCEMKRDLSGNPRALLLTRQG
jgi:release factor glutamine methyltransferase